MSLANWSEWHLLHDSKLVRQFSFFYLWVITLQYYSLRCVMFILCLYHTVMMVLCVEDERWGNLKAYDLIKFSIVADLHSLSYPLHILPNSIIAADNILIITNESNIFWLFTYSNTQIHTQNWNSSVRPKPNECFSREVTILRHTIYP